jgi:hypothetical protein
MSDRVRSCEISLLFLCLISTTQITDDEGIRLSKNQNSKLLQVSNKPFGNQYSQSSCN